jgi:hypothetical protein
MPGQRSSTAVLALMNAMPEADLQGPSNNPTVSALGKDPPLSQLQQFAVPTLPGPSLVSTHVSAVDEGTVKQLWASESATPSCPATSRPHSSTSLPSAMTVQQLYVVMILLVIKNCLRVWAGAWLSCAGRARQLISKSGYTDKLTTAQGIAYGCISTKRCKLSAFHTALERPGQPLNWSPSQDSCARLHFPFCALHGLATVAIRGPY